MDWLVMAMKWLNLRGLPHTLTHTYTHTQYTLSLSAAMFLGVRLEIHIVLSNYMVKSRVASGFVQESVLFLSISHWAALKHNLWREKKCVVCAHEIDVKTRKSTIKCKRVHPLNRYNEHRHSYGNDMYLLAAAAINFHH